MSILRISDRDRRCESQIEDLNLIDAQTFLVAEIEHERVGPGHTSKCHLVSLRSIYDEMRISGSTTGYAGTVLLKGKRAYDDAQGLACDCCDPLPCEPQKRAMMEGELLRKSWGGGPFPPFWRHGTR